jgi:hypothetical protein
MPNDLEQSAPDTLSLMSPAYDDVEPAFLALYAPERRVGDDFARS